MKKALVFDWDGTLYDSATYKRENFIRLFSGEGLDPRALRSFHEARAGIPRRQLFSEALSAHARPVPDDAGYERLSDAYTLMNQTSAASAIAFPDALRFLEWAAGRYTLFVSSSSEPRELVAVVAAKIPATPFQEVLGSRPGFSKGMEHLAHIRTRYGFAQEELLVLGDDATDVALARAAGVDVLRVTRPPERGGNLSSLDELKTQLES